MKNMFIEVIADVYCFNMHTRLYHYFHYIVWENMAFYII